MLPQTINDSEDSQSFPAPVLSLEQFPVVDIEIDKLNLEGSPRLQGEDTDHVRLLAGIEGGLPPITVWSQTMQVIDGRHRVRAALLNGRTVIAARLVECDERTAYTLAVRENIAHGLPLSLSDRKAAAVSLISLHPNWSDRVVGDQAGLSDKTVSALRAAAPSPGPAEQSARLGLDGRVRPVNSAAMRRKAADMLRENPDDSLRKIASSTGLSPATVRDVRIRINEGKDPVPTRYSHPAGPRPVAASPPRGNTASPGRGNASRPGPASYKAVLSKLMDDPSLKFSDSGRGLVRWLGRYCLDAGDSEAQARNVPDHWAGPLADLARSCAGSWSSFADQLERRILDLD